MTDNIAIKVKNLTKVYHLFDKPQDRFKEALHPFRKSYHRDFYATNDISFEIKKGETVGIIGKNGAGKSTLLKMITGVLTSTSGDIQVNGKIASLLELGAGFNPEMTGLENIYLNGTLMGFSQQEMEPKIEAILEFADIGEFISQPVKVYSSGMFARLAFSVAINVNPDILIIDEALSVGDVAFQQKCLRKMEAFSSNNKTILLVTHDIGLVNKFCSKALWIEGGLIKGVDIASKITKRYFLSMSYTETVADNTLNHTVHKVVSSENTNIGSNIEWNKISSPNRFDGKTARITDIALYSDGIGFGSVFSAGDDVIINLKLEILQDIENPIVGFIIRDRLGMDITGANNILFRDQSRISRFKANRPKVIQFKFKIPYLKTGKYSISPAIADGEEKNHVQLCWIDDAIFFDIIQSSNHKEIGWYFGLPDIKIEELKHE